MIKLVFFSIVTMLLAACEPNADRRLVFEGGNQNTPESCAAGKMDYDPDKSMCKPCDAGTSFKDGKCTTLTEKERCEASGEFYNEKTGVCGKSSDQQKSPKDICEEDVSKMWNGSECVNKSCEEGKTLVGQECLTEQQICERETGKVWQNGQCVSNQQPTTCPEGQELKDGVCVSKTVPVVQETVMPTLMPTNIPVPVATEDPLGKQSDVYIAPIVKTALVTTVQSEANCFIEANTRVRISAESAKLLVEMEPKTLEVYLEDKIPGCALTRAKIIKSHFQVLDQSRRGN